MKGEVTWGFYKGLGPQSLSETSVDARAQARGNNSRERDRVEDKEARVDTSGIFSLEASSFRPMSSRLYKLAIKQKTRLQ